MEKFRFAPGLPGYGTKGLDGSAGLNGLMMLFTNLNPDTDQTIIGNKILNNQSLWSDSSILPGNRTYQYGDVFIDSKGKVYEINPDIYPYYSYKNINLSTVQFFTNYTETLSDLGLERWANTFNSYAVDSILTESAIDYTTSPTRIYKISPIDFNRIEYTDVDNVGYNPFTVYVGSNTSDNTALAIVRKTNSNEFHIGNLNDDESDSRNVDLVFDVRKLKASKNNNSKIGINADNGTILTNYEINANPLFSPNFIRNPTSFYIIGSTPNDISINWNQADFFNTNDPAVLSTIFSTTKANLYFYKKTNPYVGRQINLLTGSFITSASDCIPLVFNTIDASGWIEFHNLTTSTTYEAYIEFVTDGWTRRSVNISKITGVTEFINASENTTHSKKITTDASGYFTSFSNYFTRIDVSSNADWSNLIIEGVPASGTNWISIPAGNVSNNTSNHHLMGSFDVSISRAAAGVNRNAIIRVGPTGGVNDPSILITQIGNSGEVLLYLEEVASDCTGAALSVSASKTLQLKGLNELPTNTFINLNTIINTTGSTVGMPTGNTLQYTLNVSIEKNGIEVLSYLGGDTAGAGETILYGPWAEPLTNINYDDTIEYIFTITGIEDPAKTPYGYWSLGFDMDLSAGWTSGDTININGQGLSLTSPLNAQSTTGTGVNRCTMWGLPA